MNNPLGSCGFKKIDIIIHVAGGGLGIKAVSYCTGYGCEDERPDDHKRSGISFQAQAGYMLFRTYDINVMARLQYHIVFNTDLDQGIVLDVGILRKPRPKSDDSSSPLKKLATSIGNTYLFFAALMIISLIASGGDG